jgi:hypothetical protein
MFSMAELCSAALHTNDPDMREVLHTLQVARLTNIEVLQTILKV